MSPVDVELTDIFGTEGFRTRFDCGTSWSDQLIATHMIADLVTAACFLSIPAAMFWCLKKRPDIPFGRAWWWFAVGTFFCGMTHISAAVIPYWWPAYRLDAAVKVVNALTWCLIAVLLMRAVPRVLRMLTPLRIIRMQADLLNKSTVTQQKLAEHILESALIDKGIVQDWNTLRESLVGLQAVIQQAAKEAEAQDSGGTQN